MFDVQDSIVLVLKGSTAKAPENTRWWARADETTAAREKQEQWEEESKDLAKIKAAYDRGASAVLLYDPDTDEEDAGARYRSSRSRGGGFTPERSFLCFTIEERVFRAIMKKDPQESPRGFDHRVPA